MTQITVHELIEQLRGIPNQNAYVHIESFDMDVQKYVRTDVISVNFKGGEVALKAEGVTING